ncbi:hypothetical protein [Flavobacterium sp. AG291]|uniref:hypothetical protein n=1 Tax=Flavobacterium sp. AG291 TaxID=2184000 RepID=UPI0011C066EE|nr:hypothetical protein [Flavobacterium sp. AG291]
MKLTIPSDFKKNSEKTIIYPVPDDGHLKISPISKIFHFGEEGIELIHETYTMPSIIKDDLLGNEAYTYEVYIGYYPGGQIKYYKVILFANFIYELRVGAWYHFDEKGRVIKKIAHEDLFKTSLAKVLQIRNDFIKDEVLNKRVYIHFENVLRVIGEGGAVCSIIRYKDLSDHNFKSLIIDDGNNFINRMMEADIPRQINSYSPYKGYFGYY